MSLPIITADQRLAEPRGIKGCIFGKSGIGKTSLLWTLDPARTLFIDLEAGDLAIEGWPGDSIRPRTWAECRDFAVFIGGPNPALRDEQPYSPAHHAAVCQKFGDPAALDRYDTIFVDSITVAGRLCFQWCKGQPEAVSEKTGKPDVRGAYGLHGRVVGQPVQQHTFGPRDGGPDGPERVVQIDGDGADAGGVQRGIWHRAHLKDEGEKRGPGDAPGRGPQSIPQAFAPCSAFNRGLERPQAPTKIRAPPAARAAGSHAQGLPGR